MEDEKKKKKNKKKKKKQNNTSDDVTCGLGEPTDRDQNRIVQENHDNHVSATVDVQTDEPKTDVDMDTHFTNGTEGSALTESEKLYLMDREVGLEETIRKVQTNNDALIQKEASLEEAIVKLHNENDKARLEETITRLQNENYAEMEKRLSLEMKLSQLQDENNSWLQKEAGFEREISQLMEETASLSLKVVSLEEKIKQLERQRVFWFEKEKSMEDTITCLNGDNTRLQIQVTELEKSKNSLLQENMRLAEIMSGMQSQISSLEKTIASSYMSPVATMDASGSEDVDNQMETASQLVEKLVAENEELVEKGVTAELSPPAVGSVSEFGETTSASGERIDSPKHIPITDEGNEGAVENSKDIAHVADSLSESSQKTALSGERIEPGDHGSRQNGEDSYGKCTSVTPNSSPDTIESEEIVQIPLDEKEVGDPQLPPTNDDEMADVSLTDAPLIGAPFRLISFMARYVSGADLVNKR